MNPWMLKIGGLVVLTGAMATKTTAVVQSGEIIAPAISALHFAPRHSAANIPQNAPPKRSTSSRQTDVSMASHFRPRGTITVGGQVRIPGPVSFSAGLTLRQVIERAGGATEFGALHRVRLVRDGKMMTFDLTIPESQAVIIRHNDTVEVPQKAVLGM
jgi:protein involved in polysaccharide export with SLBB domain